MTPSNARAKGVAGALGSLLKDRAMKAATPTHLLATPRHSTASTTTLDVAAAAMEMQRGEEEASVVVQLDMGQGEVISNVLEQGETTCNVHHPPPNTPPPPHAATSAAVVCVASQVTCGRCAHCCVLLALLHSLH